MKAFLHTFSENYKKVWSQFLPSSVISILFGLFGITAVWLDAFEDAWIVKLLLVFVISFFLFMTWSSWVQSNSRKFSYDAIGAVVLLGALIGYYLYLPGDFDDFEEIYIIRHVLITIASVGLVFISHYQWKSDTKKFWNFSRATAESIIQSIFFSAILFTGLSLTFASIGFLFDLEIPSEVYPSLWFTIAGGFTTFYFLSKLPLVEAENHKEFYYNKLWKFLGVYILLPLLALYFLVLYAYTGKVLLTWEWPSGQISYMIAAFSLVGTLTYWILTPHVEGESKAWRRYTPIFWGLLLIQVVVLFTAAALRINQYGITPKRYLVVLFGIYLLIMALYFLISKVRDRRIIPVLFSGLILLTSIGPWGVFGVSKMSQTHVINTIMQGHGMVDEDGKIQKPTKEISKEDRRQLSSALDFLADTFGEEQLDTWSNDAEVDNVRELMELYEVGYISRWDIDGNFSNVKRWEYKYLNLNETLKSVDVSGQDEILIFRKEYDKEDLGSINNKQILLREAALIEIVPDTGSEKIISLREWLQGKKDIEGDQTIADLTFENDDIKIVFNNISFQLKEDKVQVDHAAGLMILK